MSEHLFPYVLLGWLFLCAFWFVFLNYLSLEEQSGKTPLPSVGMLRHTDHQLDHYRTERYCHPGADSDDLPPVSHIGELTPGVFR